ncbi:MAG: phosphatase PAP2 family protein, partial [Candidatus Lokiarchaeota archaeon]|nr:phosphatase PAP2 family protein [Candidatus Lokiarchaeota archaeon]
MSEKEKYLSRNGLLIIGAIALIIFFVGILLYALEMNEEFYSENSTVQTIFGAITYLGDAVVFVILTAIIYIGYDKKLAKRTILPLLFSYYLNHLVKEVFKDTRPDTNIDPDEDYGFIEPSYGFPSGHAQNATCYWGYMANEFKDKPKAMGIPVVPVILSVIIFLVAISRMFYGVHDLQDVIGGLLIGIGFLLLFIYLEPIFTVQFNKFSFQIKLIFTIVIAILLFVIPTLLYPSAGLGLVDDPPLYPDSGAFAQVGGVILGFGVGYLLENEYIKYEPRELRNTQKLLNLVVGLVILLALFIPLEYLLEIDSVFYRFGRYALLAFLLTYVLPL